MDDKAYEAQCIKYTLKMLDEYKTSKIGVQMLKLDLQMLEAMVEDGTAYNTNMAVGYDQPPGGRTNKVSSAVESDLVRIETKCQMIKQRITYLTNQNSKIELALSNLPEPQKTLIKFKYLEKLTWKQVCQQFSFSDDYVRKELKDSAVKMMAGYLFLELYEVGIYAG